MNRKRFLRGVCAAVLSTAILMTSCGTSSPSADDSSAAAASEESASAENTSSAESTEAETSSKEVLVSVSESVDDPEFSFPDEDETEADYHDDDYGEEDEDPEPETAAAAATTAPAALTSAQQQYESQKAEIQAKEAEISASSQIPCIYINTLGNAKPASKETYLDCTVDVFNVSDGTAMSGVAAGVRVRGNSSAEVENPPLKIKFAEQQNLLGLHNGETFKVWVILKTNWFMTADHMAFKLGKTLLGSDLYVSDSKFAHVYVNGTDWGICLAAEQNQVQADRVNVKESESETTSPTDMGYYFEMDNYAGSDDAPTFWINNSSTPVTDINGVSRTIKDKGYTLKNSHISSAQLNYISTYMNSLWQVIYKATYENAAYTIAADGTLQAASNMTPEQAVEAVLDIDSAVNMYILEEIFHDYDRGAGSFFMAVDFSSTSQYKKLTFLSPWDFGYDSWNDDGTGLHAGVFTTSGDVHDSDNIWLITLFYNKWFRQKVTQRYAELMQSGALKTTTAAVEADLSTLTADAALTGQTSALNGGHMFVAYTDKRIDWLASYFATMQ